MEKVMGHFFLRALIEESMGAQADWNAVDSLMQKAMAAAEKVARYRHAQLSAVRLAGDVNARPENVNLEELLETIRSELVTIGPLLGLDVENLLPLAANRSAAANVHRQSVAVVSRGVHRTPLTKPPS
jgi:hypothetical protein